MSDLGLINYYKILKPEKCSQSDEFASEFRLGIGVVFANELIKMQKMYFFYTDKF